MEKHADTACSEAGSPPTYRQIVAKAVRYLTAHHVPDPAVAAELLVARLLACGRGLIASCLDRPVPPSHVEAMRRALRRLAADEPLQYVLGEWDFRTLTLRCDPRALIPRPETEELVTRVLKFLEGRSNPFVIDVGTGTGAIILSIAAEFKGPGTFWGTDISPKAIELANFNADFTRLAGRVHFSVMDGLDGFDEPGLADVIVSNPPYIAHDMCAALDPRILRHEPLLALDGGAEGLDFYDRYLGDALNLLKPGGAVFFEIGNDQGEALRELMTSYGFSNIRIEKDFAGLDRYASAVLE